MILESWHFFSFLRGSSNRCWTKNRGKTLKNNWNTSWTWESQRKEAKNHRVILFSGPEKWKNFQKRAANCSPSYQDFPLKKWMVGIQQTSNMSFQLLLPPQAWVTNGYLGCVSKISGRFFIPKIGGKWLYRRSLSVPLSRIPALWRLMLHWHICWVKASLQVGFRRFFFSFGGGSDQLHPGKWTAGTWKSPVWKENHLPSNHHFWVPC